MDNNITIQTTPNIWENVFLKSQGSYFQYIIYKLGKFSDSVITNDEAKDLLKTIRIEKRNFSKKAVEIKLIKTEEIPFEIPKNWVWCRLGEITNYGSSEKGEPKNMDSDTWVLDLEDIEKQTSKLLAKVRFSVRQSQSTKSKFKKGDVLYSKLRPYLDKVIVADEDGVCTTEILPLKCFGNLNSEYLKIALKSAYFLNYVNNQVKGMKMPRLETKAGQMALIPLPPLSEQKIIVEFLNKFKSNTLETEQKYFNNEIEKDVIALHLKQLRNITLQTELKIQSNLLSKLRQAYLQEAVMGKLTESSQDNAQTLLKAIKSQKAELIKQGKLRKEKPLAPMKPEEIPFEIPDNWVWCRLGEITNIFRGSSPRPKGDNRYFSTNPTDYNWITISDISNFSKNHILHSTREFLTEAGTKMGTFVDKNEFIIAVSGSTTGKCCLTGISGYVYDGLGVVRVFDKSLINEYLLIYMLQFYSHINSSKEGSTFPNINTDFLKNLLIPIPPLSEQKAIIAKVEGLLGNISLLESENKAQQIDVQRLMGAVLQEAFGGQ